MVTALSPTAARTAWEPCDRCGAGAAARITLASGGLLHLCGHHLRDHRDRLAALSAEIHLAAHREHLDISATG